MTYICVSKLPIIGLDNGLSPGRRQAIIWTNDGLLLIGPIGTNFSEILIEIRTLSFKEMHLKMSSGKWRPFCLGLNVLTLEYHWEEMGKKSVAFDRLINQIIQQNDTLSSVGLISSMFKITQTFSSTINWHYRYLETMSHLNEPPFLSMPRSILTSSVHWRVHRRVPGVQVTESQLLPVQYHGSGCTRLGDHCQSTSKAYSLRKAHFIKH